MVNPKRFAFRDQRLLVNVIVRTSRTLIRS